VEWSVLTPSIMLSIFALWNASICSLLFLTPLSLRVALPALLAERGKAVGWNPLTVARQSRRLSHSRTNFANPTDRSLSLSLHSLHSQGRPSRNRGDIAGCCGRILP
jgi:hypothetical protein